MTTPTRQKVRPIDYSLIAALLIFAASAITGYANVKSDIAVTKNLQCEIIKRLDRIEAKLDKWILWQRNDDHGERN